MILFSTVSSNTKKQEAQIGRDPEQKCVRPCYGKVNLITVLEFQKKKRPLNTKKKKKTVWPFVSLLRQALLASDADSQ